MVEITEYRGRPVIAIKRNPEDRFPFSFGVTKAKLILDHIEEIRKFVEENSGKE